MVAYTQNSYGIVLSKASFPSADSNVKTFANHTPEIAGSTVHPSVIEPWTVIGDAELSLQNLSQPLSPALPTSLNIATSTGQVVGISNPGYWGIEVKVQQYSGSFWVKGSYEGSFTASLFNYLTNETLGSVDMTSNATYNEWREHSFTLTPETDPGNVNNTFRITFDASGTDGSLDFNLISLFPPTYNNRPNGMRIDLMEALKGLNPVRTPFSSKMT